MPGINPKGANRMNRNKYYIFAKDKDTGKVRSSCGPIFDTKQANKMLVQYREQYEPEYKVIWRKSELS